MSKLKPILFNTEMVKAILDGRKTVTRRVVKPQPEPFGKALAWKGGIYTVPRGLIIDAPYQKDDVLWVRETWWEGNIFNSNEDIEEYGTILYAAGPDRENLDYESIKWKSSRRMPFEAARIFLVVTDVHIEKLQDITEGQAINEGIHPWGLENEKRLNQWCKYTKVTNPDAKEGTMEGEFAAYWDSITKKSDLPLYGWNANPYVWVIEFERINKEDIPK